jgi:hypothetical protein
MVAQVDAKWLVPLQKDEKGRDHNNFISEWDSMMMPKLSLQGGECNISRGAVFDVVVEGWSI